jgi:acyl-coenzyme A thioesterase PaaI-like protein
VDTPVGVKMRNMWQHLSPLPGGKLLFSLVVGIVIPYTGSMRARVEQLQPGHAIVRLPDRRRIRNHLRSIHAIALANLAEFTTGLATLSGMPDTARAILVGLEIEYSKKARGDIIGECITSIPVTVERQEYKIEVILRDSVGDTVATAWARWLIAPQETSFYKP